MDHPCSTERSGCAPRARGRRRFGGMKPTPDAEMEPPSELAACLLCGRGQGLLEASTCPPTGPIRSPAMPGGPPVRPDETGRLHCVSCGGSIVATEVISQLVRMTEPPLD